MSQKPHFQSRVGGLGYKRGNGDSRSRNPVRTRIWLFCTIAGLGLGYFQPFTANYFVPSVTVAQKTHTVSLPKNTVRVASSQFRHRLPSRGLLTRTATRRSAAQVARQERSIPPANYHRAVDMKVTAYTPINTAMEGGRWTATMEDGRADHGVAVDPDVIPLGSRLWVPGYGYAVADDTGGAIRGNHIDIRVQKYDHMDDWGVRNVRVYVVEQPE